MYFPKQQHPNASNNNPNMQSGASQTPFFFGGSQVPTDLFLPKNSYSGSSGSGLVHKGSVSKTHPSDLDFTTKKGDEVYHQKNHNIKIPFKLPFMG
jgi:hypothetical protein